MKRPISSRWTNEPGGRYGGTASATDLSRAWVVISNKVKTLLDGRWRSLDSRPVHAAVTAISAHYNAMLADRLSGTFGLRWEARDRGADRNPQWEIAGVPDALVREFSSRTREIEKEKDRLIGEYVETKTVWHPIGS